MPAGIMEWPVSGHCRLLHCRMTSLTSWAHTPSHTSQTRRRVPDAREDHGVASLTDNRTTHHTPSHMDMWDHASNVLPHTLITPPHRITPPLRPTLRQHTKQHPPGAGLHTRVIRRQQSARACDACAFHRATGGLVQGECTPFASPAHDQRPRYSMVSPYISQ